jgi:hypothetical protein
MTLRERFNEESEDQELNNTGLYSNLIDMQI